MYVCIYTYTFISYLHLCHRKTYLRVYMWVSNTKKYLCVRVHINKSIYIYILAFVYTYVCTYYNTFNMCIHCIYVHINVYTHKLIVSIYSIGICFHFLVEILTNNFSYNNRVSHPLSFIFCNPSLFKSNYAYRKKQEYVYTYVYVYIYLYIQFN